MLSQVVGLLCFGFLLANANVLEYTDSNFDDNIARHSVALVKFYAPWCGHCKRLAPEFEAAATALAQEEPVVTLIKVDCTEHKTVCGKVGVSGYPTLKIYKNGVITGDYDGPRSKDGIVKYMRVHSGDAATLFDSKEKFDKIMESGMPVFIGHFNSEDTKDAKLFKKIAESHLMDFKFAYSIQPILPSSDHEFIRVYYHYSAKSKREPDHITYHGEMVEADLRKWMKEKAFGLFGYRSSENDKFFSRPLLVLYDTVDCTRNPKSCTYLRNRLHKISDNIKEKISYSISDRQLMSHELMAVGVEPPYSGPPNVIIYSDKGKYLMTEKFGLKTVEEFIKSFFAGKLSPYLKSEDLPADNSGPLKTVVAKNFDEIVNNEKDVLVEFYAEWCGHCKALKPIWAELAEKMKKEPGITIAAMEATRNDVPPNFEVTGFPTIYFVKKGKKDTPIAYSGGRELKDFIKYLSKEATDELVSYDRSGVQKKTEL